MWPRHHHVATACVVFLDYMDQQFFSVDNVYINYDADSDTHQLSPRLFDIGSFMYGTMLNLAASPPT